MTAGGDRWHALKYCRTLLTLNTLLVDEVLNLFTP